MLEKLGEALKKATDKIAKAVFLDKKTIEEVTKELQRALISADVNVHLVKEITDKIKEKASDESIKGIEKREQLIKLLYDTILEIIGGEKQELKLQEKRQTKIMLLGLYGCGKCVHGESKIQLSSGEIPKIRDLYNFYSQNNAKQILEDGEILELRDKNLSVPSFNQETLKIENKKVTHLWKLKKEDLYEIKLDNGNDFSIKVTPEHPFFVLRNGRVKKIRADELVEEDYIATPREIEINGKVQPIYEDIKKLDLDIYLTPEEIKEYVLYNGRLIKDICKDLKYKRNYCRLTADIKKGKIPIELMGNRSPNIIKIKEKKSTKIITFPTSLTLELSEFLGYLMSDGYIGKNYIQIVNEDTEIIFRLKELSKLLFNIEPTIKRDYRTKKMYKITLASKSLIMLLNIFNLKPGRKGKQLKIPEQIMLSNNETLRAYIKAYFDCDSSPEKNARKIELSSESQILIQQMNMLLKRFGIVSTISNKLVNNLKYWRLTIKDRYAEKYAEKIGYIIKHKQERANNFKQIESNERCGNQDMIPLGRLLKELRVQRGFSIDEIENNAVYSYRQYEEKGIIPREKLLKLIDYYKVRQSNMFSKLLNNIENNSLCNYSTSFINGTTYYLVQQGIAIKENNQLVLTTKGKAYLQQIKTQATEELLNLLENLANSNVNWLSIKEINKIKNDEEYVYDLTVEDNHSFIAEGFIVHNTTTISKLGLYYSKRGKKVALLGLDVHRPAAMEQLEQLAKQNKLAVFIDKIEKDPIRIYKKFEPELQNYDILIMDTAGRHTLDKELVKEIKELNKEIKPDYRILVIPADIGQAAKQQASEFQKALEINGVIITRMDSTAKAGGALTACHETKAPVLFIGTGEKMHEIETFNPKSFISRVLGLGDLEGILEKIQTIMDKEQQKNLKAKLEKGEFDLRDFQEQIKSMSGMSFSKMLDMVPGFSGLKGKIPDNILGVQEEKMKKWQHIINSMTQEEIKNPEIIEKQTTRLGRIAKGSGANTSEVRSLLKQYKLIKEFTKGGISEADLLAGGISQKNIAKLAKKFGKKIRL